MSGRLVPALVPSLALPARPDVPDSRRPGGHCPLPMSRLRSVRDGSTVYGLTTVDNRGRVADQHVARALGWRPGDPLCIRVIHDLIMVVAAADGPVAVSTQGRVHLPAAARHACGITPGERVLLAAEPADGVLVVHPLAALDAMVSRFRDHGAAGEEG